MSEAEGFNENHISIANRNWKILWMLFTLGIIFSCLHKMKNVQHEDGKNNLRIYDVRKKSFCSYIMKQFSVFFCVYDDSLDTLLREWIFSSQQPLKFYCFPLFTFSGKMNSKHICHFCTPQSIFLYVMQVFTCECELPGKKGFSLL